MARAFGRKVGLEAVGLVGSNSFLALSRLIRLVARSFVSHFADDSKAKREKRGSQETGCRGYVSLGRTRTRIEALGFYPSSGVLSIH